MSRPKLVIYLPDFSGGGVPRLYLQLAPGFAEAGFDVRFLVDRKRGEMLAAAEALFPVDELGAGRQIAALPKLYTYLKATRPEIILSAIEQMNIMVVLARLFSGVPVGHVASLHNPLSIQAKRPGWQFKVLPFVYRLLIGRVDAMVAVSKGVADDLAQTSGLDRSRITVVYNGIPLPDATLTAQPGLPPAAAPTIVSIGRLSEQKDQETLLRAFARLNHQPAARLTIVGAGPLLDRLTALAAELGVSDRVHFTGFISDPERVLAASQLFVLSSRYEGFGLVIVEALAAGVNVVSTDCPHGPSEILDGGRYGRLVKVGDVDGLAAAMAATLADPIAPETLMKRAGDFSLAACCAGYVNIFRRLVAKR